MSSCPPLSFRYEGEGEWKPASPFMARKADGHYVIGQVYALVEHSERSMKSHAHYFAQIKEYWSTLPESLAHEFPSAEHLRKKALIRAGWADEQATVLDTHEDAIKFAAFAKNMDEFSVVVVSDRIVKRYVARSQNFRAMNKEEFQKSKDDVLKLIDDMLQGARAREADNGRAD